MSNSQPIRKAPTPDDAARERMYRAVGPLAGLGLTERWHAALLLPLTYREPLRKGMDHRKAPLNTPVRMTVTVASSPRAYFNGAPRVLTSLIDGAGEVFRATVFGNTKEWQALLVPHTEVVLRLRFEMYQDTLQATILAHAGEDDPWASRVEPIYPGIPSTLAPVDVRDAVANYLPDALPRAAREIADRLAGLGSIADVLAHIGAGGWTVEQLLQQAHEPLSIEYAEFAREMVLKLSGLAQLMKLADHHAPQRMARAFALKTVPARIAQLPFTLTAEQVQAIEEMAARIRAGETLKGLLMADVGFGKTACFGVLAAAVADDPAGGRAAILLPNAVLAQQVTSELASYWPDLNPILVTGETANTLSLVSTRLLIGTSALLHREIGRVDLVVIDEEQKFAVDQKAQLAVLGAHQLTVTATCIPRTLALARYGALSVAVLSAGHVNRCIETTLRQATREDRAALFADIRQDLRMGQQVIVIYPVRDRQGDSDIHSVEAARDAWGKTFGPERIRTLTGDDSDETKRTVMDDMRQGRAQILLATTVVEVGITLAKVRRVVVVRPDRFGASTLHQLRGRAARHGGEGNFDMQLTGPVSAKTLERLEILVDCRSGFEVAERDLELRGYGDLAVDATLQSGADGGLLFGQPCPIALTDALLPTFKRLSGSGRLSG